MRRRFRIAHIGGNRCAYCRELGKIVDIAPQLRSEIDPVSARPPGVPYAGEFPYAFLEAFGRKETTIKRLRSGSTNASDLAGGVLERNNIHIAVCEAGKVGPSLSALKASFKTAKGKARFILTTDGTDGTDLEAEEVATGEAIACAFSDLPNHFGFFLPLAVISTAANQEQPHRHQSHKPSQHALCRTDEAQPTPGY